MTPPLNGNSLYSLAIETTLGTKLGEFQYKILDLIIFSNKKNSLVTFKMVESPLCAFCNAEEEPRSIYCIFVSRVSFGKNFYLGLRWIPILHLMLHF